MQWGEAARTKDLDKEATQGEGLKLQDEGLAVVQAAVKDNPLRALHPLLDALMAGNKATPPSSDGHVAKCKATVPIC